jgi:hypothetical protein
MVMSETKYFLHASARINLFDSLQRAQAAGIAAATDFHRRDVTKYGKVWIEAVGAALMPPEFWRCGTLFLAAVH